MSSLLKPQEAFEYAKEFVKEMPLERVGPKILDDVSKMMWMAAPWRWTLGSMPVVTLTSNTQDYTITIPSDFLFLTEAYLTDGTAATRELEPVAILPTSITQVGQISKIAVTGTPGQSGTVRVGPKPGTQPTSAPQIISLYKKSAPTITAQNMSTAGTQLFDDEWFWVFREGVLWKAYLWGDDSRAGAATVSSQGQIQYSGQRGSFEAALAFMKANEKLPK